MKKIFFLLILFPSAILLSQTWSPQVSPTTLNLFSASASSPNACWMCGPGNVVIRTTDGGYNWYNANGNLFAVDAYTIFALDANYAWIGAGDGKIYRTTNGGLNWSFIEPTPTSPFIDGIYFYNPNTGFAYGDCVNSEWRYWISTNGGLSWAFGTNTPYASSSTEAGWSNGFCTTDTGHIWWTSNNYRLYRGGLRGPFNSSSLNFGASMVSFINTNSGVITTGTGALWTSNGGLNWSQSNGISSMGYGLSHGDSYYWISTTNNIYRSTNFGTSFTSQYTLVNIGYCVSMFNSGRGWCGTATGHIFRYDDFVGILPIDNVIPKSFSVSQNYPNPFNPTTTIEFSIPRSSNITLNIYDVLGNEVMNVVNEFKPAGNYSVNVDAAKLSSGIYFYAFIAGEYKATKKMLLVR